MRPLRVSCKIQGGNIVSNDGLFPLDSILAAAWMQKNHPEEFYNDGAKSGRLIEPALPLAEVEIAGRNIWAASVAQYNFRGEYTHHWHKRLDPYIVGKHIDKPKKVVTTSAKYKAYRMPVNVMLVGPVLTWYCVGDPDGVRELLAGVKSLGKKRAHGFGAVELDKGLPAWCVEEYEEDWSIYGPGGRIMRAVPFDGKEIYDGMTVRRSGIRPPYWHRDNKCVAIVPKVGDWDGRTGA